MLHTMRIADVFLRSRAAGMNAAERPLAYKESICEESHVIADADRRSCPGSSATCRAAAELRSASRRVRLPIPRQAPRILVATARSEERRVGKECRSRWRPAHEKRREA